MANSKFKHGSGVFNCEHCGRATRDTNGSNGGLRLCEDCEEGFMQENGLMNSEGSEAAEYEKGMRFYFQRAVNKGGKIAGYEPQ